MLDCYSRDRAKGELLIIQDSPAVEQAKRLRDREAQAILRLADPLVDPRQASIYEVLDNDVYKAIIAALGVGIDLSRDFEPSDGEGLTLNLSALRYVHIYIVTENAEAGAKLRENIIALFHVYEGPIISAGKLSCIALDSLDGLSDEAFTEKVLSRETRRAVLITA